MNDMIYLFSKLLQFKLFICIIFKLISMRWWILSVKDVVTSFDHATFSESLHVQHFLLSNFMQKKQLKLWNAWNFFAWNCIVEDNKITLY